MKTRPKQFTISYAPLAVMFALLLFSSCDFVENTGEAQTAQAAETIAISVEDDTRVIINLAAMQHEVIALSRLAQQRSTYRDVTELARTMETAHTRTLAELNKLAEDRKLIIPTILNETAEKSMTDLNKLSGKEFDVAYCEMMVEGHGRAIAILGGVVENATDEDLRGWASRTLPQLRQHLEHAWACQQKCEAAS